MTTGGAQFTKTPRAASAPLRLTSSTLRGARASTLRHRSGLDGRRSSLEGVSRYKAVTPVSDASPSRITGAVLICDLRLALSRSHISADFVQPPWSSLLGSQGCPAFLVHVPSIGPSGPSSWIRILPQPPPVCHFLERSALTPTEPEVHGTCVGGHAHPGLMPPGVSKSLQVLRVRSIRRRYRTLYEPRWPNVGFAGSSSLRSQHSP